jgi:hypothetical protein
MKKSEEYIKKNPEYKMCLVDKKFGNGKLLIKFFYNRQINNHNQGFLAYVDNQKWLKDNHAVMDEVQLYLEETEGVIDDYEFVDDYNEYFDTNITLEDVEKDDELYKKYEDWFKNQFPKICLYGGGVCHFSAVS